MLSVGNSAGEKNEKKLLQMVARLVHLPDLKDSERILFADC